jgi:hypoxanthine phosphoribosyltransferase
MDDNQRPELQELISPSTLKRRVGELAEELSCCLDGAEPWLVLGVLRGAVIFMADLVRALTRPVELDFMRISSYGAGAASSGRIELLHAPQSQLRGRSVLVVEDVVDTGLSLSWLEGFLSAQAVERFTICALLDKPACRRPGGRGADLVGFTMPPVFLVGYGMDWNQKYRYLPGIYRLFLPLEPGKEKAVNGNNLS